MAYRCASVCTCMNTNVNMFAYQRYDQILKWRQVEVRKSKKEINENLNKYLKINKIFIKFQFINNLSLDGCIVKAEQENVLLKTDRF